VLRHEVRGRSLRRRRALRNDSFRKTICRRRIYEARPRGAAFHPPVTWSACRC